MGDNSDHSTTRLVLLGGPGVGKSAIVKRFLFNQYPEKHKPTVEDWYSHKFDVGLSIPLKVDILDTAGDIEFPAMRRLSITNAHAFLIVYGIDSKASFDQVKECFEEIREQRSDFLDVPIIIAGNKADLGMNKREVEFDEVCDWVHDHLPKLRGKAMECSAKENRNVREIFKAFLANIPFRNAEEGGGILKTESSIGLRRRSSAYAGSKNRNMGSFKGEDQQYQQSQPSTPSATSSTRNRFGFLNARGASEGSGLIPDEENSGTGGGKGFNRNQSKSQSLIRRCSRKAKQRVRDGTGEPGDCRVS